MAENIDTLQTTVGTHTAAIETNAESIDGIHLQYTVKLDNNGFMSGFGLSSTLVNSSPYSDFAFQADRFSIINPNTSPVSVSSITRSGSTATATTATAHGRATGDYVVVAGAGQGEYNGTKQITVTDTTHFTYAVSGTPVTPATGTINMGHASVPFVVVGGVVYMDTALIKDATITGAMIAEATIDSAHIASLAAGTIEAGDIDVELTMSALHIIGGDLNIANKFLVDDEGNATIRSATSGARMEMKNNVIKVYDGSGTLRVQIGDLTA